MRARLNVARGVLLAAAALAGCGELTDGPGHCVEATPDWWPLRNGIWWQYEELDLVQSGNVMFKDLTVEHADSTIGGLAGDQHGVRTWRADWDEDSGDVVESGWRWFLDTGTSFAFRRDIWTDNEQVAIPCPEQGAFGDPSSCADVTVTRDVYYLPERTRLDYSADKVCENSSWDITFTERTIAVGVASATHTTLMPCPRDVWREDPLSCDRVDEEAHETWDVQYVDRAIDVPAGHFEHCLCVRRTGENDKTYCFAKGIGKVFELDRQRIVECLSQYRIDEDTFGPPDGWDYPCDMGQVEE